MNEKHNPWTILSKNVKYDNNWINVTEHQVINPTGGRGIYGVVHLKNYAIGVVPMDADNNIYLVGQYRFPLNQYSWEIPEGGGALDIDPLASAKRELLEETGYEFENLEFLSELYANPATATNKTHCFLATGGKKVADQNLDLGEEIIVELVSLEELKQLVKSNKFGHALHSSGIFYALLKLGCL